MRRLKEVYSRRTKKEKILTVGVLVIIVLLMLLVTARCGVMPNAAAGLSSLLQNLLLWLFAGDIQMTALAVFLVCALPTVILSAAAIDEVSQKKTAFALPFYFYILLFFVEELFYQPMEFPVITWLALMLLSGVAYMLASGQKGKLLYVMAAGVGALMSVELGSSILPIVRYVSLLVVNGMAAFLMNRASVLKKKYWYLVMLVLYVILFFVGRVI